MIRIIAQYGKNESYQFDHVAKIVYMDSVMGFESEVVVEGDKLLSHHYPIDRTLWIHSENEIHSISHTGLRTISVSKIE